MQKNRISFLKVGGGFSEARGLGPFLNIFYGSIKEVLGGFFVIFLFHPFIDTPYLRVDSLLKQMQSIELNKLGRKSGRCCVGKARGAKVKMSAQLTLVAHFEHFNTSLVEFANVARGV